MPRSIGIVGLPNVGKSTLFNALTTSSVPAENYPFCTIEPSVGIAPLDDKRLLALQDISNSKKVIPAVTEFVDIAGLVEGASKGEGLGNQFLSHIREVDALLHVVRAFQNTSIARVGDETTPLQDIEVIEMELVLADLATVERSLSTLPNQNDKETNTKKELYLKLRGALSSGTPARDVVTRPEEEQFLNELHLLSKKPVLYAFNISGEAHPKGAYLESALKRMDSNNSKYIIVDVVGEALVLQDEPSKQAVHLQGVGEELVLAKLVSESYALLDLISFFTTGPEETRAWTITRGESAKESGAAIHSDFSDKFIRAEIVSFDDLVSSGSMKSAREKGLLRIEGKDYIVQDGDVVHFRI